MFSAKLAAMLFPLVLISGEAMGASYGCGRLARDDNTLVAALVVKDKGQVTPDRLAPLRGDAQLVIVTCTNTVCGEEVELGKPAPLAMSWEGPTLLVFSDALASRRSRLNAAGYKIEVRPLEEAGKVTGRLFRYEHKQCRQRPSAGS